MVLPNFAEYCETNSNFRQPRIVKEMSRNHSKQLSGRLHFNDNSLAAVHGTLRYDKLFKIRPIIDAICEKRKSLYNPGKIILIDEAMMKFNSRPSIK